MNELPLPSEQSDMPPVRPGIFYENLSVSQAEYEAEHRPPKPGLFSGVPKLPMAFCVLSLLLLMAASYFAGKTCDPSADAITGSGTQTMNNREFAIYYWEGYKSALSSVQQQRSSLPFDTNKSLERQYYDLETGKTWESYFMDQAESSAALTMALAEAASDSGFILSSDQQERFCETVDALPQLAASGGYLKDDGTGDVGAYVRAVYGPSVTEADFDQYLFDRQRSGAYAQTLYQAQSFSDQEISDCYDAGGDQYSDLTRSEIPNVDVLHILIAPENTTYAAKHEALENAASVLQQFQSGSRTADAFAALYRAYSSDRSDGSVLLSDVSPDTVSESFSDWCFDPSGHQTGDTAVVESDEGYYVLYFSRYRENYHWKDVVLSDLRTEGLQKIYARLLSQYPCHLSALADIEPLAKLTEKGN